MKYLKHFETEAEYIQFKNSEDYILPNVSYVEEINGVMFNPDVALASPNLVCVYDIVDASRETQIMSSYASYAYTSMIVDGVEMDFDCYYQFDTEGLHTVEFIFDEEYKTELPGQGFDYVTQLVSISIPESITSVSNSAIVTTNLKEFKGKFASEDGKCLVVDGELVLSAKKGFEGLTKYIIPNGVTTIGYNAFSYCDSLTDITIPDSVTTIGSSAFTACSNLTSVTIGNSVTTIEQNAFQGCTSLASVTIGNGITSIDGSVFSGCDSLARFSGKFASEDGRCLIIDGRLIKAAAAGLTEYTIPDSVTTIGSSAFAWCSSLTSVTIPDSVTTIDEHAFQGCTSLTSVTIGNGITSIEFYAFDGCSNLTSVYCKAITPPKLGSRAFNNNASDRKFYVPMDSLENYKGNDWRYHYADGDIVGYNF